MEDANHSPDNPYTTLEGYAVLDAEGDEAGRIGGTIYDAPTDVLKYIVVNGRAMPADRIEVDAEAGRVIVPHAADTIASAPEMDEPSGEFDEAVRRHYGIP